MRTTAWKKLLIASILMMAVIMGGCLDFLPGIEAEYAKADVSDINFTSHDDWETISYASTTVKWSSVSGASKYRIWVKVLDGNPGSGDNEPGEQIYDKTTTSRSISISKSKITSGKWLKVYVQAYNSSGKVVGGGDIYLYVDRVVLEDVEFTSHDDRETVKLTASDDDFKVSWGSVSNADGYQVRVKLLNGAPKNNDNNEPGILIIDKDQSSRYVYIDKEDVKDGKWVKVWVCAYSDIPNSTKSSASIYLYITVEGHIIPGNPYITSHDNKEIVEWSSISSSLTFKWSAASNAHHYEYTVKLLDGEPNAANINNEAGTILASSTSSTSKSVSISKSKLAANRWVKIGLAAVSSTGKYSAWDNLYVYVKGSKLGTPSITAPKDRATLYIDDLSSGLNVKWTKISQAASYWYSIKLLDGSPKPDDDEPGTVIAVNKTYSGTSVNVPVSKLKAGKWLKIWVQANASAGYIPSDDYIYVYLDKRTEPIGQLSFTGRAAKSITTVDLAGLSGGLKISWKANNAVKYTYKAILLKNAPTGADNESAYAVRELAYAVKQSGVTSITLPKSALTAGYYVKIAVVGYDADGNNSGWKWIGFKLTDSAAKVGKLSFTGRTDKSVTTVDLAGLSGGLKISWKAANAVRYTYKAILLQNAPTGADNESAYAVKELAYAVKQSGVTSITLPKSALAAGYYVKIAVVGYDANGNNSGWKWIGFKLTDSNIAKVGKLSFTGRVDKSVTPVDLAGLSGGLKISWKASNAVRYTYKAILLKNAPTGADNESAIAVKELAYAVKQSGLTTVTIPKSALQAGYYVKIAAVGFDANGNNSGWKWIGFKLTDSSAPKVGQLSFTGYSAKSITPVELSDLSGGLKISWKANNAVSYKYRAILINEKPTDESAKNVVAVLAEDKQNITSLTIDKSKLKAGCYVKIAVVAYGANGENSGWKWIGFKFGQQGTSGKSIIIKGIDIGYDIGDYFTKDGMSCRDAYWLDYQDSKGNYKDRCHDHSVCVDSTHAHCNCMRYWPTGNKNTCQVDLLSSQCMGFARYCQWKVYGVYDKQKPSVYTDLTGKLSAASCTEANLKKLLRNCSAATHIRTGNNSHSISVISTTDTSVKFVHCNADGYCGISEVTYTWAQFAQYFAARQGIYCAYSYTGTVTNPPLVYSEDELVAVAKNVIFGNEGSYTTVAKNDSGSMSIGKLQWNANAGKALALLRNIIQENPSNAKLILGNVLYNEITNPATSWTKANRIATASEAAVIAKLLGTTEGKRVQDAQANTDVSGYLKSGKSLGLTNVRVLVYYADLYNQRPASAIDIAKASISAAGSASAVTLDIIHDAAMNNSIMNKYTTRRNQTYEKCKLI